MTDMDASTFEAELVDEDAARDIAKAVSARHSIARKYVMRVRRRQPDATPAEVIQMLERHYVTSISTAGAIIAAGAIAADIGIALIPGVGAAAAGVKSAGQQAAKQTGNKLRNWQRNQLRRRPQRTWRSAPQRQAPGRVAGLLPAGDEQLQFEITAIFGLALADIHEMDLDQDQAHALVYGLSNGRVSQQQIATMATDLANVSVNDAVEAGYTRAAGRSSRTGRTRSRTRSRVGRHRALFGLSKRDSWMPCATSDWEAAVGDRIRSRSIGGRGHALRVRPGCRRCGAGCVRGCPGRVPRTFGSSS